MTNKDNPMVDVESLILNVWDPMVNVKVQIQIIETVKGS